MYSRNDITILCSVKGRVRKAHFKNKWRSDVIIELENEVPVNYFSSHNLFSLLLRSYANVMDEITL